MAQTLPRDEQSTVVCQLDTYNHVADAAGPFMVKVSIDDNPPSGLVIALKQNGSTIVTSVPSDPAQIHLDVQTVLNCAMNDVIGVTISSAVAATAGPNAFKAIINIHKGNV